MFRGKFRETSQSREIFYSMQSQNGFLGNEIINNRPNAVLNNTERVDTEMESSSEIIEQYYHLKNFSLFSQKNNTIIEPL